MTIPDRDIEALVAAFAESADPEKIAAKLGTTAELVVQMLEDPEIGKRAIEYKVATLGVVFAGRIVDNLVKIAAEGSPGSALQASRMLLDRYIAPKPAGRPPKDPAPNGGSYEDGLKELKR